MTSDYFSSESLISDPLHGYITFTAARNRQEPTEQTLIDHPWVQRLRRIHQLQSAWWVYPSAEHALPARPRRHAPGRPGGHAPVRDPGPGVCAGGGAVAGVRREPG